MAMSRQNFGVRTGNANGYGFAQLTANGIAAAHKQIEPNDGNNRLP